MDDSDVKLEGVVERIIFLNEENFYCIASVRPSGREKREPVTVAGVMPAIQCGETVEVEGQWRASPYGKQVKVKKFKSRLPSDIYGIEKYLGSGLVDGIGPVYAKKIVAHFGSDTLNVIDTESARLTEVRGIGAGRAKKIKKSWDEQKELRSIMVSMGVYGVGTAACVKIMRRFGADAARVVREEPYTLAREIDGIGFKTADMVALNMGVPNESPERLRAGVIHCLSEAEDEGHTCVAFGELVARSSDLLKADSRKCAEAVAALVADSSLKNVGAGFVQSAAFDFAERNIASCLKRIWDSPSELPPIRAEAAAKWAGERAEFDFAPGQTGAIVEALRSKISVITGGPGTGKTTILRALCDILKMKKVIQIIILLIGVVCITAWLSLSFYKAYQPQPKVLQGQIAAREYNVSSKIAGRISEVFVSKGDMVKKGDLIYTIHSPELEAKVLSKLFSSKKAKSELLKILLLIKY